MGSTEKPSVFLPCVKMGAASGERQIGGRGCIRPTPRSYPVSGIEPAHQPDPSAGGWYCFLE